MQMHLFLLTPQRQISQLFVKPQVLFCLSLLFCFFLLFRKRFWFCCFVFVFFLPFIFCFYFCFYFLISTALWVLHCLLLVSAPKAEARLRVQWRCFNEAEKKKPPKKTCLDNDTSVCCMQTLLELHSFMRVTVPGDIIENVSVWKGFFKGRLHGIFLNPDFSGLHVYVKAVLQVQVGHWRGRMVARCEGRGEMLHVLHNCLYSWPKNAKEEPLQMLPFLSGPWKVAPKVQSRNFPEESKHLWGTRLGAHGQLENAEKSSLWWATASSGFQKLFRVFELSLIAAHLFLCAE